MSHIDYSHLLYAISSYASERFDKDVQILDNKGQIIILVEKDSTNESLRKFRQTLYYLSFPKTWYHKSQHAAELVFEEALANLNLPLQVRERQRTVYIHKPPEESPLELYSQGKSPESLQRKSEKLKLCYETIDKALSQKKKFSYITKRKHDKKQTRLTDFYRIPEEEHLQLQLDAFVKPESERNKKARTPSWRKIRLDIVYKDETPESQALIFGEVKAFSSVTKTTIERRVAQLQSYDAWLVMNGDEGYTPLLYLLPTIPSHVENPMFHRIKEITGREIIPVCVTTSDYIKTDFTRRMKTLQNLEGAAKYGVNINPELFSLYSAESQYISRMSEELALLLQ